MSVQVSVQKIHSKIASIGVIHALTLAFRSYALLTVARALVVQ